MLVNAAEYEAPTLLVGQVDAATALSQPGHAVTPQAVQRLGLAGVLGPTFEARGRLFTPEAVERLSAAPMLQPLTEAATVLRVGPAVPTDSEDRTWLGWHEALYRDDPEAAVAGVDRWWQLRTIDLGRRVLVTVAGFVVLSGRITEVTTWESLRRLRLDVDPRDPDDPITRLPTGGGGPVLDLPAAPPGRGQRRRQGS